MPSTAGKGFGSSESDYKTLFEKVTEKTGGERKSFAWYKNTFQTLAASYQNTPERILSEERRDAMSDNQDGNKLRTTVRQGHLYYFEYKAKMKYLPYYDKFPLAYVFGRDGESFYAANLHYIRPKLRVKIVQKLERGLIDIPRQIVHKYLNDYVESLFLDLVKDEWDTTVLLPLEDFVITKGSGKLPYDREYVWEEMKLNENNRIKAKVVVKDY